MRKRVIRLQIIEKSVACDVAKLAVTLSQGRVLEPERGFNPFTRSIFPYHDNGRNIAVAPATDRPDHRL